MAEKWTGVFIGKCHNEQIPVCEVAKKLGYTKEYVSMILHGKRNPSMAKERFFDALRSLVEEKKQNSQT